MIVLLVVVIGRSVAVIVHPVVAIGRSIVVIGRSVAVIVHPVVVIVLPVVVIGRSVAVIVLPVGAIGCLNLAVVRPIDA